MLSEIFLKKELNCGGVLKVKPPPPPALRSYGYVTEPHQLYLCLGAGGFSHPSPALPTDGNFDSVYKLFSGFTFGSEENDYQRSSSEVKTFSGYQVSLCNTSRHSNRTASAWLSISLSMSLVQH